jgi:glycerol dehydrogenase-like iron-containing ADH family enzyme
MISMPLVSGVKRVGGSSEDTSAWSERGWSDCVVVEAEKGEEEDVEDVEDVEDEADEDEEEEVVAVGGGEAA